MKKSIYFLSVLILITLLFSACKKGEIDSNSLIGKWRLDSQIITSNGILSYRNIYAKENSYVYQFNLDNSYTLTYAFNDSILEKGTYKLDSSQLFHQVIGVGFDSFGTDSCAISGNKLNLSDNGVDSNGNFTQTFFYTRL
jgi:hypothetical protein